MNISSQYNKISTWKPRLLHRKSNKFNSCVHLESDSVAVAWNAPAETRTLVYIVYIVYCVYCICLNWTWTTSCSTNMQTASSTRTHIHTRTVCTYTNRTRTHAHTSTKHTRTSKSHRIKGILENCKKDSHITERALRMLRPCILNSPNAFIVYLVRYEQHSVVNVLWIYVNRRKSNQLIWLRFGIKTNSVRKKIANAWKTFFSKQIIYCTKDIFLSVRIMWMVAMRVCVCECMYVKYEYSIWNWCIHLCVFVSFSVYLKKKQEQE